MRVKTGDLSPPAYEAKLVWTDVPWNFTDIQLCAQEGCGFLRPESEILLPPNFNQRGYFLHFHLRLWFAAPESLYLSSALCI